MKPTRKSCLVQIAIIAITFVSISDCAKILAVIPTASYSHQIPFRPLWRELSLRGHQVTVMTTDPMNDPTLTNLTEIDMHYTYEIYKKYNFSALASDESKSFLELGKIIGLMFNESFSVQLLSPEVQNLLHNKDVSFDLLIIEAQVPMMLGFSWKFNCPWIGVASLDAAAQFHDSAGNPSHPLVNPDNNLHIEDVDNMSFKERVASLIYHTLYRLHINYRFYPTESENMKQYFGEDLPSLIEIQKNISMLFVSTNPIFHNIRPLNPNTITIGSGLHLQPPKPLPKSLQMYLDDAKEGVIYFSLGSNIKGDVLNDTTKAEILKAFAEVPYKVLMKIDAKLVNVPSNVRVEKWLPQQDLLRHPNVKLFITQGGLQSLQESIINSLPLIGIPFFGDQPSNVAKMVKKGYGVKIDKKNITKESLLRAIQEIMNNPKYRETAKKMGEILLDEPMTSLDKAVWWIEYVIRHKGAKHLRGLSADLPLWKFLMLDVIGLVALVTFLPLFIIYKILKCISKCICGKICKRSKGKKEKTN